MNTLVIIARGNEGLQQDIEWKLHCTQLSGLGA